MTVSPARPQPRHILHVPEINLDKVFWSPDAVFRKEPAVPEPISKFVAHPERSKNSSEALMLPPDDNNITGMLKRRPR